ncbi:MAG: mechanosensitive ion channel family protein [Niabella sp.]
MFILQTEVVSTSLSFIDKIKDMTIQYAPKVLGAILVYIIGSWIINLILKGLRVLFNKRSFDATLQNFLLSTIKVVLLILLVLTIFAQLGGEITSFAAILAGAGLAIGGALNGSLGNLAGGVMMMIFKPFKVGDFIEAQDVMGTVKEIGIFQTVILSPENKTIYLPNGPLSTGTIKNNTIAGYLRVDLEMPIAPDMPVEKARQVAINAMMQMPEVLDTPTPEVNVVKVGDGMIMLAVRPYTAQPDYWTVYFGVQEVVKKAWDENGIALPVPHRVIINK